MPCSSDLACSHWFNYAVLAGKGQTTTVIKSCEEVKGGVLIKHNRQCLQPDQDYNVVVKGKSPAICLPASK